MRPLLTLFLSLTASALLADCQKVPESKGDVLARARNGRLFSLFSVVTFKNEQCTGASSSASNPVMGTCLAASECDSKADSSADGSCASGFGVCCVTTVSGCGNTITENCTYVQNTGYPTASTDISTTCTTTIARSNNLCQIRLDFESFTSLLAASICSDMFTVSAPFSSSTNAFPPPVCGTLTGQHMYYDVGATGNPTFTMTTSAVAGSRTWRIKVTQIECNNPSRAPAGCAQYFTGVSGLVESYNFAGSQLLNSQLYQNCVRREDGYCSIRWAENPGVTDAYNLGDPTTATMTTCNSQALTFNDANLPTLLCGGIFSSIVGSTVASTITTSVQPFRFGVTTEAAAATDATGFSLAYTQVPC